MDHEPARLAIIAFAEAVRADRRANILLVAIADYVRHSPKRALVGTAGAGAVQTRKPTAASADDSNAHCQGWRSLRGWACLPSDGSIRLSPWALGWARSLRPPRRRARRSGSLATMGRMGIGIPRIGLAEVPFLPDRLPGRRRTGSGCQAGGVLMGPGILATGRSRHRAMAIPIEPPKSGVRTVIVMRDYRTRERLSHENETSDRLRAGTRTCASSYWLRRVPRSAGLVLPPPLSLPLTSTGAGRNGGSGTPVASARRA